MDLKKYYQELNELEGTIAGKDVYVVSWSTPDGGKAGIITHVPRRVGCQLVIEGKARLASAEEIEAYEREQGVRRAALEHEQYASRIQVHVVADSRDSGGREVKPIKG